MTADDRTARSERPVREGRLLGDRYRLVQRLDAGGTGEVWRARDLRLDRDVAIKILGTGADDSLRIRFADEARRAAAVAHPNVVAVFDEGRDGTDAYMVMEYVRGRTLREVVAERGPLPPPEAARIVAQVAAALDAAHAVGLVHCDVKPANVIVDEAGTAKLTDFGVARATSDAADQELIGTARYIAPERIAGRPATPRSDVYGLGLVAFELFAGRPAFAGAETADLLRMRLEDPPPSLRSVRLGIPADVEGPIRRALARNERDRYASAGAFARALGAAVERGGRRPSTTGARSDPGRVRAENEDRYLAREHGGVTLLAVADGVGGEAGGAAASGAAIAALAERFFAAGGDLRAALAAAVREANDAVLRAARETGQPAAASTLVAAAIRRGEAAVANLGDSRAYLLRAGVARQITADHSGAQPSSITRFLGDPRGVQPDVFVEPLRRGDRLVLCSDGLTRHVTDGEIAARAAAAAPQHAADELVALAIERGGEDNVTMVVHRVPVRIRARALAAALLVALLAGAAAAVLTTAALPAPRAVPTAAP